MAGVETRPIEVMTRLGSLRGSREGDVRVFRGIPYAAPPVGPLRFRPPEPPGPWSGVLDATRFGAASLQPGSARARLLQGDPGPTGEDCLTLNIWAPGETRAGLPVIVWVHGGAFTNGAGSVPALHGHKLAADAPAVVVTLNYRLGVLGFGHHRALTRHGANLGLRDLTAALEWVHANIADFGGDPERVTLAGESAGSMCVALLSLAPDLEHLFQQTILHSGIPTPRSPVCSERAVEALAARLGVTVPLLRSVPGGHLITAARDIATSHRFWPTATGDPDVAPARLQATAPARPTLISTTADEGTFFFIHGERPGTISRDEALSVLASTLGGDGGSYYNEMIHRVDPLRIASAAITEHLFTRPADDWAGNAAAAGSTVFRARYGHPGPAWGGRLAATHTIEIPLLFGTFTDPRLAALYEPDSRAAELSVTLRRAWARFLHTGSPSTPDEPWRPWRADEPHARHFS